MWAHSSDGTVRCHGYDRTARKVFEKISKCQNFQDFEGIDKEIFFRAFEFGGIGTVRELFD